MNYAILFPMMLYDSLYKEIHKTPICRDKVGEWVGRPGKCSGLVMNEFSINREKKTVLILPC